MNWKRIILKEKSRVKMAKKCGVSISEGFRYYEKKVENKKQKTKNDMNNTDRKDSIFTERQFTDIMLGIFVTAVNVLLTVVNHFSA